MIRSVLALLFAIAAFEALAQDISVPSAPATSANPSATIGLSAVNGTATTFMTSDSAPPLSQAIAPTWTGLHKFTNGDLGLLGSSTGYTQLESGLSSTSNNILTLPTTASDTLAALGTTESFTAPQTFALGTITTNIKAINITGTFNASGTTFDAPLFMNVTNTASNGASNLADFQVNSSPVAFIDIGGGIWTNSTTTTGGFNSTGNLILSWHSGTEGQFLNGGSEIYAIDTGGFFPAATTAGQTVGKSTHPWLGLFLGPNSGGISNEMTSTGTGAWQLGAADAAAPVAQILHVQSVVTGTSNTNGTLWKLQDSAGTGTGTSGGYEFDYHPHSTTGSTPNAAVFGFGLADSGTFTLDTAVYASCSALTTNSSGNVSCTASDPRLKDIDPVPFAPGATEIARVVADGGVISFKGKPDNVENLDTRPQAGFNCWTIEKYIPRGSHRDPRGYCNLEPNTLMAVLFNAVAEQQAEIAQIRPATGATVDVVRTKAAPSFVEMQATLDRQDIEIDALIGWCAVISLGLVGLGYKVLR